LALIGRPYFQADASHERRRTSTGLGLSIVQALVALHGGALSIQSSVGEGTRVTVRLPIDCQLAKAATTRRCTERPFVRSLSETAITRPMPSAMREMRLTRRSSGKTTVKISA
jgi:cell cycle sensor histidine kinase DivJ